MTWPPSADAVALKHPFRSRWLWAGIIVWTAAFAIVAVRVAVGGSRNDLFPTYQQAGIAWAHGQPLYRTHQGFIYTPPIAAFFTLLAWVPPDLGAALWRLLNVIALLAAALWWFRRNETNADADRQGLFLLLLFPISLGNLNNGQVNPSMIALLISAVLLAKTRRWTLSALCVTVAAYFKVYPLAVGLLLAVIYPKEFSWRLLLALTGTGLLSLVFQHPDYVIEQYRRWFESRRTDPRRYDIDMAPRDLWMLTRAFHLPLTETLYAVIQTAAAGALAFVCGWGRFHHWPEERLLHAALLLGCSWMLLLGPSTESATYVLLAPVLVYALFTAARHPIWMRSLVIASYATLLLGLALNSFLHLKKNVYLKSVQPFGALLFLVYACAWIFSRRCWKMPPHR
jgi:hypothetical protein